MKTYLELVKEAFETLTEGFSELYFKGNKLAFAFNAFRKKIKPSDAIHDLELLFPGSKVSMNKQGVFMMDVTKFKKENPEVFEDEYAFMDYMDTKLDEVSSKFKIKQTAKEFYVGLSVGAMRKIKELNYTTKVPINADEGTYIRVIDAIVKAKKIEVDYGIQVEFFGKCVFEGVEFTDYNPGNMNFDAGKDVMTFKKCKISEKMFEELDRKPNIIFSECEVV